jgi:hypothetical protein
VQEDFRLIIDLVTVLGVAAVGGLMASLLRQPVLLGYLLAGMLVGPAGFGVIKEVVQVETLAQFGVAFLLFARAPNSSDHPHHGRHLDWRWLGDDPGSGAVFGRGAVLVLHGGGAALLDGSG